MLDDEKRFNVLLEQLKFSYTEYIDLSLKVSGILLIVIGWFSTGVNPLKMLCNSSSMAYIALLFVLLGEVLMVGLNRDAYIKSATIFNSLYKIEGDITIFQRYRITKLTCACTIIGHFSMMFGIFFFIYYKYISLYATTCTL